MSPEVSKNGGIRRLTAKVSKITNKEVEVMTFDDEVLDLSDVSELLFFVGEKPVVNDFSNVIFSSREIGLIGSHATAQYIYEITDYFINSMTGDSKRMSSSASNNSKDLINTSNPGGIKMNRIDVNRQGDAADIQFDPAVMQDILQNGVEGFAPVIINLTPIPSILPMLGLDPANKEDEYAAVASLN